MVIILYAYGTKDYVIVGLSSELQFHLMLQVFSLLMLLSSWAYDWTDDG